MNLKNLTLKKLLKAIKLNESSISMFLGVLVVIIVATLVVKYLKTDKGTVPTELLNNNNSIELSVQKHTVEKGENLWMIATKYYGDGFKWVDIATENKLANAGVIETGQELVIPELETAEEATDDLIATDTSVSATVTNENAITAATYEVAKGDSLWKIAIRAYGDGYKWVEIARENKISHPNIIHPGNILVLPR